MTRDEFSTSLAASEPPLELSAPLRALWLDAKGDWDAAHEVAQADETHAGANIHAYLHRKEGDLENARYWYAQARRGEVKGSLEAEWAALVEEFLRAT